MSSSSSSSTRGWKPDVFLNFYGDDTRNGFTSHLYAAFTEKGINAFMDDEKLERGKLIAPELCKAIEESKYAVVVLSRNYALSRWCLFELDTIVECKKKKMLTILPIFYHVKPSHVRHQKGSFAEAFARYEQNPNIKSEDLQTWKAALREVGNTAGWLLHNRSESAIIKEIVATIQGSSKLSSGVCKDQVGLIDQEFRGENFSKLKDIDQSDQDVLGIIYDGSQEVVLKLDIHDEKAKQTAIKTVSTLAGIDSIRMDMKVKKLTVIGTMDPIELVSKLRKYCYAEIISIGRPKQVVEKKEEPRSWKEEPKKEEKKGQQVKKEEIKKKEEEEEKISELVKAYNAYNPYLTQYYYVQTAEESNPNSCVIC